GPPCPSITAVQPTTSDCVDPATGKTATICFAATVTNPSSMTGNYAWDFGDGNTASTATPAACHTYTQPRNYLVTVSAPAPSYCTPNPVTATTTLSLQLCPCPAGQHRDAQGNCVPDGGRSEGFGCLLLRWAAVLLIELGLFVLVIYFCKGSSLPYPWN